MKIKDLRVMRGPNFWSITEDKLIVLKLDLSDVKEPYINQIPGFSARLERMFPKIFSFTSKKIVSCQEAQDPNHLGHVFGFVALELQRLAGMNVEICNVCKTDADQILQIILSYQEEEAGVYAVKAALRIIQALFDNAPYDFSNDVEELSDIRRYEFLGLSTGSIVEEALKRNIPYMNAYDDTFIILGYGTYQKRIQATIANTTGYIGVDIAGDKDGTKRILKAASIPIPEGMTVDNENELIKSVKSVGYPLVTKPLDGNHGRGITLNVTSFEEAIAGYKIAKEISDTVIVEKYITGFDYRMLVVNFKYVATVKRSPASITGDGHSTILQLIERVNAEPRRQKKLGNILQKIEIDELTLNILKKHHLSLDSVLDSGTVLYVKETGNVSAGAIPVDVTDSVHPYNIFQAERIAKLVGLDICGIDLMSPDLSVPWNENGGAVIEVNAAPGIRMHIEPAEGTSRNVAGAIVDMLFPEGKPSRIPIVAITGTNGKTTATRLVSHIATTGGLITGYTTTEGIYINEMLMESGDCSGPQSARYILKDTMVEYAILECARGGILRSGLAFKQCDIGIVTNVSEDHLGLNDINNLEDMAKVKSVVPRTVVPQGYAILNADDLNVYNMRDELNCNIALFSLNADNEYIQQQIQEGKICCYVENNKIILFTGTESVEIENVTKIPFTYDGKADFMVQNALPAVIAGYVSNFSLEVIRTALRTFESNADKNPGRLNFFDFPDFRIMLDYAHNPAGLEAIGKFIKAQGASWNIGIIAAPGDRRDEDIRNIGKIASKMFDQIIIRDDDDLRGRTSPDIHRLLIEGVKSGNSKVKVDIIPRENDAINFAIEGIRSNSLISVFSEHPSEAIKMINDLKSRVGVEKVQNVQK